MSRHALPHSRRYIRHQRSSAADRLASLRQQLLAAAPAWYEFLCGPVTEPQVATMRAFLKAGVSGFGEIQAIEAARLFNAVGRTRRLRVDSMIAATAIVAGASLATANRNDFHPFVSFVRLLRPQAYQRIADLP